MKPHPASFILHARRLLRCSLALAALLQAPMAHAATDVPMFYFQTITDPDTQAVTSYQATIHGTDYTFVSAVEQDDTLGHLVHTDSFLSAAGETLTIQGLTSNTTLALVTGQAGTDSYSGVIESGNYSDLVQQHGYNTSTTWPVNGKVYYWQSGYTARTVDLIAGSVTTTTVSDTYALSSDSSRRFTVATDASGNGLITGAETGVVYADQVSDPACYFDGPLNASLVGGSYTLFGRSVAFDPQISFIVYTIMDNGGTKSLRAWVNEFHTSTDKGSWLDFSFDSAISPYSGILVAYTPEVGRADGSFDENRHFTFGQRTAPSFAGAYNVLWVDDVPFTFDHGTIEPNGDAEDTYSDSTGNRLKISGNLPAFMSGANADPASVAVLNGDGQLQHSGSLSHDGTFSTDDGSRIDKVHDSRSTPYFTGTTDVWVSGSRLSFDSGLDASTLVQDTYVNSSVGTLILKRADPADSIAAVFRPSGGGSPLTGTYDPATGFAVEGADIQTHAPLPTDAPAFWIAGVLYTNVPGTLTYTGPGGQFLAVTGSGTNVTVSGSDGYASFSGTYAGDGRIFTVTFDDQTVCVAYPANSDGSIQHSNGPLPDGYPPAIVLPGGRIWQFLGTAADETDNSLTSAYYGNASDRSATGGYADHTCLLKIRNDGRVFLSDYVAWRDVTGTYDPQKHLFQSDHDSALPMPIFCADPLANYTLWGLATPPAGLPPSVLVDGQIWRYTGSDVNGAALYEGYFAGQQMLLTSSLDGSYTVNLVDAYGNSASGTYRNGAFQVVGRKVTGSDERGQLTTSTSAVTSISGDLDILGSNLTLGSLKDDASLAGASFSFADDGTTASLISGLNRPVGEWLWTRAGATPGAQPTTAMKLGQGNIFQLQDPADASTANIVFDPSGPGGSGSRINGPLRVAPSGDLDMGGYTHGPRPDGTPGTP
jgi:hypothetical protein